MNQLRYGLSAAMLLFALAVAAQNGKLQISAELRPRIIIDDGYSSPKAKGDDSPVYITQRTRLNALFSNEMLETYVSLQDVRIWGDDNNYKSGGAFGNTESLSLHQAWAKLKIIEALSLKVGRQIFLYDDQRILSSRNWNDYQVTYDAVLAEYITGKHRIHLGLSYNADNKTDMLFPDKKFKTFDFIHYQCQLENFTLTGIALTTGNTHSDTTKQLFYRETYGVNANYKTDKANARLSAYYQHNLNEIGGKTSAFCISAHAERELIKKLSFGLRYDYLSGNDEASTSGSNNRFDILYGRRHIWYGYMDYFNTIPEQGLQDYMALLIYKPKKNISVELHYHYFMLAEDKYDRENPGIKLKNQLGQELDFSIKWKFHQIAALECGYSLYGVTNTLEQLKKVKAKDIGIPQFCFLMLTIQPGL